MSNKQNDKYIETFKSNLEDSYLKHLKEDIPETLIDLIKEEMENDYYDRQQASEDLIRNYQRSTPKEKHMIDLAFIALCGFSLETLITTYERMTDNEPN